MGNSRNLNVNPCPNRANVPGKIASGLASCDFSIFPTFYQGISTTRISHFRKKRLPARLVYLLELRPERVTLHFTLWFFALRFYSPSHESQVTNHECYSHGQSARSSRRVCRAYHFLLPLCPPMNQHRPHRFRGKKDTLSYSKV